MEATVIDVLTSPDVMANGGLLFLFLLVVVTVIAKNAGKIQLSFGGKPEETVSRGSLEIAGALVSDKAARDIIRSNELNTEEMRRLRENLERLSDEINRCARATENSTNSVDRVHNSLHSLALELRGSR